MTFLSWRPMLVALAVLALSGCGALTAQNPSGKYTPVNAVADGDDSRVILKGADVVAYFVDGKYLAGKAQFSSKHEAVTFRFASAEHKALFDKEPGKYLPQFGGYCANGIAYAIPWGGDADTWKIIDGKLYIFGGQASKDAFELDEKKNLALAESYWKDEIAGSNSFIQRSKRLVFRVPHYQSGEELAQAVAKAKGAK
ncbi:MAG TPA: YHS domain-containing (seleno)protein [Azonexus sp.]|nr:YHS domain-containing (seleno)protein [Azonexus sp.]